MLCEYNRTYRPSVYALSIAPPLCSDIRAAILGTGEYFNSALLLHTLTYKMVKLLIKILFHNTNELTIPIIASRKRTKIRLFFHYL